MSDSCTLLGNRLSQWEKNLDEEEMNPLVSQFYFSCGFPIIKEELFLIEALFSYKVKAYSVCSAYFFYRVLSFPCFHRTYGNSADISKLLETGQELEKGTWSIYVF